jgi:hypothetical protein
MLLIEVLMKLYPDKSWLVEDSDTYDGIVWGDMDENDRPTEEFLQSKRIEFETEKKWKELREERNKRIAQTDYLAIPDYPHATEEVKQAWLDYRQALRDLPGNTTDPENPVWPTPPGA